MQGNFLFDTNSLLYILKTKQYQKLDKNCHLLDLTFYEYGNAVLNLLTNRRNSVPPSHEEIRALLQAYEKITEQMTVISYRDYAISLPEIFDLAKKENMTFYDASYLYCCMRYNLKLITEDKSLLESAQRNSVDAYSSGKWSYL
jgi:predicted nucleic acid-binding protein